MHKTGHFENILRIISYQSSPSRVELTESQDQIHMDWYKTPLTHRMHNNYIEQE